MDRATTPPGVVDYVRERTCAGGGPGTGARRGDRPSSFPASAKGSREQQMAAAVGAEGSR